MRHSNSRYRYIGIVLALMVCAVSGTALATGVGDTMPSFYLKDLDGNNFFLTDHVGETANQPGAVIFSFCASYCKPCKKEIPELGKLVEKYGDSGLSVYLISLEKQDKTRELIAETGTTLPVLIDRYLVVQKLLGFTGIPFTVLIDRAGTIRFINTGFSEDHVVETMARFEEAVRAVLDGTAAVGSAQ